MQKFLANDGIFLVSKTTTKENLKVAFCYAWESATEDVAKKIVEMFENYFELENENDLWLKEGVDFNISVEDLKKAVALDKTDSMVLINLSVREVLAGVEDWLEFDTFEKI